MVGWILAWLLTVICILGGAGLVFLYGLSFGNDVTYQWMVAVITAFFFSVFVFQPIKIVILTCLISALCKRASFGDDHVDVDENPPHIYWDENDPAIQGKTKKSLGP